MDINTALNELTSYKQKIREAEHNLASTVAEARATGASWSEIGGCLGVSKQAAQQQYADAKPNTYRCNCGWSQIIPVQQDRCRAATDIVLAHIKTEHPDVTK